ncbi:MAG: hypothetical protein EOO08_14875 [Chitinophagaceae bacterium]|nr:MAG: hypothetical protein EOO08_14875 [Chitinophagaceae bacterium]
MRPLVVTISILFLSCSEPRTPNAQPSPRAQSPATDTAGSVPRDTAAKSRPAVIDSAAYPLAGAHRLTLQWISWDDPGTVQFTPAPDSTYTIRGEQRTRKGDYLRIEGTMRQEGPKKLLFIGRVEHRISTVNGGQPCVKEGAQVFLSTKGRQYWRMQDMRNCEGGLVTDYVDIYFD